MKRKPGMAISTDLSPPRRLTDLADTPSTGGRTTIVQKTPVHPPQIQWTQSGEGPITPSDFGESWLSKRSDFPEFSNPQDVVRFGYAQGTEEGSVSAISRSPLVSPGQNQQAIVQQAFQDEKSPTSSTSGSEAELKTAQVVALSRETTLSPRSAHFVRSSSGTKVTLREAREKIQQLKQYEQTDTLPASNELLDDAPDEETPRAPTFLSGSHPVRMTAQSASSVYNSTRHNSVGSDMSPDASRQRSMQATIETATGMADELQQSRGPLEQTRSNEAWWSSQNTTRESRSTHTSQTWQRSSGSSTQDDEEPAFFPLPPAYRTLPYRKPTPSVV